MHSLIQLTLKLGSSEVIHVAIVTFHNASMATDIWSKNTKLGVIHTLFKSDNSNVAILYLIRFEISKGIHRTLRNPSLFTVFQYSEYVIKRWEAQCCDIKKKWSILPSRIVPWSKSKVVLLGNLRVFLFQHNPYTDTFPSHPLTHPL